MRRSPWPWLAVVNLVLPWGMEWVIAQFSGYWPPQIALWTFVIVLFTLNEAAPGRRLWPRLANVLNIATWLVFKTVSFITAVPLFPAAIRTGTIPV